MLRATSAIFACVLIYALLIVAHADDSYWNPSEDDLKSIFKAELQVPAACETGKYPEVKEFLTKDYFHYPEFNFKAKWSQGEPKLRFHSRTGLLREINLSRYNRDDINSILYHWGFRKNSDAAMEYRTKQYQATTLPYTPKAAELTLDENGKVVFPQWFSERESGILADQVDPYYRDPNRAPVDPSTLPYEVEPSDAKIFGTEGFKSEVKQVDPVFVSSKEVVVERIRPAKGTSQKVDPVVAPEADAPTPTELPHDEL